MRPVLVALVLMGCTPVLCAQEVLIPMNEGWQFKQFGQERFFPAEVPGVVHTDLLRNGLIPDPYLGDNVDSVQWIENADWVYQRTFFATESMLAQEHLDLVFEGLDTFAEVYLNDSLLGITDNMFRIWKWAIDGALEPGFNELKVIFRSPIRMGAALRDVFGIQLPHDSDPSGVAPYIRKAAFQFGWDFCPRLVTSGIWKDLSLRAWNGIRIQDLRIEQEHGRDSVVLHVKAKLSGCATGSERIRLSAGERNMELRLNDHAGQCDPTLVMELAVDGSKLWWTNGQGPRNMIEVRAEVVGASGPLSGVSKRIGLRTIELDQRTDSIGKAFTFVVNGVPTFMKGCNLVPPDMFLPRAGDSAWVHLVGEMRAANMNMVRVWAGGIYPPDAFYAACDTAGILVWQDLMFASIPAADSLFVQNVRAEVRDQVARIHHHPSLALWCGNNELQVAWANWGWQERYGIHGADSIHVGGMLTDFFEWELAKQLGQYDNTTPYTPTSALSNWGNAKGLRNGDLHYWGVWHADSAFSAYANNVGRFMSEYGFQSYPDSLTLARYVPAEELRLGSAHFARMQRSYRGNKPILDAIKREFGTEPKTLGEFIFDSQKVQALAYEQAIAAHWHAKPHVWAPSCGS
ncbi:MAG: hypothetical protein R2818_12550 [Flavobacteriales bacterium]